MRVSHTVDPRNKISQVLLNQLPLFLLSQIDCITLGKVTRYNKSKHECNVQPLPLQSDKQKRAIYNYCIVPSSIWQTDKIMKKITKKRIYQVQGGNGGSIKIDDLPKWKPMQRNSIVIVGACDREIDNFNGKRPYKIMTDRMHSFNDAIILGVVKS